MTIRIELRPRPVETAPTLAEAWEPIGEPWPLRFSCWTGWRGNPARDTHPATVSLCDGRGRVVLMDDDDTLLEWEGAADEATVREVARWLNALALWDVQAISARLAAMGWRPGQ